MENKQGKIYAALKLREIMTSNGGRVTVSGLSENIYPEKSFIGQFSRIENDYFILTQPECLLFTLNDVESFNFNSVVVIARNAHRVSRRIKIGIIDST